MSILRSATNFGDARSKDMRQKPRKKSGAKAWIRLDGFAVRPCEVVDLSDNGVQIRLDGTEKIPASFSLLLLRNASQGRQARVKWRRGPMIGAVFA
jgi:hypothetical protein